MEQHLLNTLENLSPRAQGNICCKSKACAAARIGLVVHVQWPSIASAQLILFLLHNLNELMYV